MTQQNNNYSDYDEQFSYCEDIFLKKMNDYGTSWRIMRVSSLIDQITIKAKRIRSIEEKGNQLVTDDTKDDMRGIINYCIISLIQIKLNANDDLLSNNEIASLYAEFKNESKALMIKKNHDYGDAWKTMRISSFTDLILSKLVRINSIIDNEGKTIISEGIDANLFDIINYAIFSLIKQNQSIDCKNN
jgi:hypothetical protein